LKRDKKHAKLGRPALDSVAALAERLGPSPLKEALQAFVAGQSRPIRKKLL
jgi:hypothetical protein